MINMADIASNLKGSPIIELVAKVVKAKPTTMNEMLAVDVANSQFTINEKQKTVSVIVDSKQTNFDIAIQATGSIEYSMEMAKNENSSVTDDTKRGRKIVFSSASIRNKNITEFLKGIKKPATAPSADTVIMDGDYDAGQYNNEQYKTKYGE